MEEDLKSWKGCKRPEYKVIEGRYVRLEPMDFKKHCDGLFEASTEDRYQYLVESPMVKPEFIKWFKSVEKRKDFLYYAIIDKKTGKVGGRQRYMNILEENGLAEIGGILWGPLIAKQAAATEAFYLFAKNLIEELKYRRLEWRCDLRNHASIKSALRFGFTPEGVLRQQNVVKGNNRDTAMFSITDQDWSVLKDSFEAWLNPDNFDENGIQKKRLEDFRKNTRKNDDDFIQSFLTLLKKVK